MIEIQHVVLVERAPAEVFAYLIDPANAPLWQAGVIETRSAGKLSKGARFTEVRTFLGQRTESTMEVTEYEPSDRFNLRAVSGPWPIEVLHSLAPAGSGTRLEVTFRGETKGRLRLAAPMLERAVRSDLERNLAVLKEALEAT